MAFDWKEMYIGYVHLDHRTDRLNHILIELDKAGLVAERTRARLPSEFDRNDPKLKVQWNRTPGSIGCWYSQVSVMKKALEKNRDACVLEDDVSICSDIKKRLDYIQEFLNNHEWDVFWLGGTVHINPPQWHIGGKNPDLPGTTLTRDAECTEDPRIIKTYGAFSTHAYIVNKHSIEKVIRLLDSVMYEAMGIDWAFIRLGAQLNQFMFLPGCVKQIDNLSDIGQGMTIFSGFAKIGPYWWQDKMENFDPSTFDFGEAKNIL